MRDEKVREAMREARRFLKAATAALTDSTCFDANGKPYSLLNPGKASGALRRASMDLTRVLAEMRKR